MRRPRPAFILRSNTYVLSYRCLGAPFSKSQLLDYLLKGMGFIDRTPVIYYLVCQQRSFENSSTFHVVLVYPRKKVISIPNHYNYLGVQPLIQVMPNNAAALEYVYNGDPQPLTNMTLTTPNLAPGARDYYNR